MTLEEVIQRYLTNLKVAQFGRTFNVTDARARLECADWLAGHVSNILQICMIMGVNVVDYAS